MMMTTSTHPSAAQFPPTQARSASRSLLAGLVDDAAVFPPGNAPLARAVPAHHEHAGAWYADLVGPFLCPHGRLAELQAVLGEPAADAAADVTGPLPIGLIVRDGPAAVAAAVNAVVADPRLRLAGVEVAVPSSDGPHADPVAGVRAALAALDAELPADTVGYVELPWDDSQPIRLDVLAGSRHRAKFRTGGTEAAAFPSEAELARVLLAAVERGVAFKCTAGLHEAVRHTDPATGFEHHGFLNLLLATDAAGRGAGYADTEALLAQRSEPNLAGLASSLSDDRASAVRGRFVSYGTCSITEPVADLVRLGLLASP